MNTPNKVTAYVERKVQEKERFGAVLAMAVEARKEAEKSTISEDIYLLSNELKLEIATRPASLHSESELLSDREKIAFANWMLEYETDWRYIAKTILINFS